jgi:hypothetical protein
MALIGGGGAGNVAGGSGSSFGASNSFQLIGDHIYGYNGGVNTGSQNVNVTMFQSDTVNYYVVGKVRFSINGSSGDDISLIIFFNDQKVYEEYAISGTADIEQPIDIIIPPYTTVKLTAANRSAATAVEVFTTITGKVYG